MNTIDESVMLLQRDPILKVIIEKYPLPTLDWERRPKNIFESLVRSIIFQQLSGKAASTIHGRLLALFPSNKPTPELLLGVSPADLRSAGISAQKVSYLHSLADYFSHHKMTTASLAKMISDEIIAELVTIKGVGEWTVHMLLIFTLHRLDILPTADLGVRKGMQIAYNLPSLPNQKEMETIAEHWRDHASIASRYFWLVADEKKK